MVVCGSLEGHVGELNRRSFLRAASVASAGTLLGPRMHALVAAQEEPARATAANDFIQIALIGAGGQGQGDTKVALQVPGVKLVAVADCYDGRLARSKELWGKDVFTTRDYNEILARKDIDAVIIGTPDHWHKQASVDAMKAGKDVYCEKPMIHLYSDGPEMIETARATNRIIQIGSQRVSSVLYAKAKELLAAGAIGKLNMVTAHWDRNSAIGAWDLRFRRMPRLKPATGRALKARRRRFPSMLSTSSNGGNGRLMGREWRATCLCICSAARTSLPVRTGPRGAWPRVDCASGKTVAMCPM